ncbi:hypothetical protein ACIR03_02570 [Clostridium cochlearium]|uniref:hypothetical protein n=1 Tax=Clostridium cochlearium TaxID=1494 RepID=UPI0015715FB6|nr:hypothetical protein [Clostridium cochlearium]MBV1816887.1 hypothetical protein [Bacteroidales bacterium MSK.15.36]MCG4571748.1 hypothetical protein [Clostridium cochlearium]MCG4579077.1 hypothetical protein [Clostridium cochlearium]NSJ90164.1 hypothetical protein [Coprococcus sp. MSK.21.13]
MGKRKWTREEEQFILKNKGKMTCKQMGEKINRSKQAVEMRFTKLKKEKEIQDLLDRGMTYEEALNEIKEIKEDKKQIASKKLDRISKINYKTGERILAKGVTRKEKIKGEVIYNDKDIIVVNTGIYTRCINKVDIYTGELKITREKR